MTVYDDAHPWDTQVDRDAVEVLVKQYAPDALVCLGIDALMSPTRILEAYAREHLSRSQALDILTHYPYLTVPSTPLHDDMAAIPDEGSFEDIARARFRGLVDGHFHTELFKRIYTDPHQ